MIKKKCSEITDVIQFGENYGSIICSRINSKLFERRLNESSVINEYRLSKYLINRTLDYPKSVNIPTYFAFYIFIRIKSKMIIKGVLVILWNIS